MDKTTNLIELVDVAKVYGQGRAATHALDNVRLNVRQGEFVAMMGPSGSGKSTCLNLIGCIDKPTRGSYRFDGVAVDRLSRDQRAMLRRHFIGFIFQGFNLLNRTSALENVELPLIYRKIPARQRREQAREALASVGLADEPTGNLDSVRSGEIMEILQQFNRREGITVVMVTHEPDMAAFADRVIRFKDGGIIDDRRRERGR